MKVSYGAQTHELPAEAGVTPEALYAAVKEQFEGLPELEELTVLVGDQKVEADQVLEDTVAEVEFVHGFVKVICGANETMLKNAVGKTVGDIYDEHKVLLSMPRQFTAEVDGEEVNDDYTIEPDVEELEFKRPSGDKG